MPRRPRNPALEPLATILETTLKKRKIFLEQGENRLNSLFRQAVGPQVAAQSEAIKIKNQILLVQVRSSVWLQQLHFLKGDILGKLRPLLPDQEIKDLRFSLTRADKFPKTDGEGLLHLDHRYLKDRDKKMIGECRQALRDTELAEIISRVMTKEIIRRRILAAKGAGRDL